MQSGRTSPSSEPCVWAPEPASEPLLLALSVASPADSVGLGEALATDRGVLAEDLTSGATASSGLLQDRGELASSSEEDASSDDKLPEATCLSAELACSSIGRGAED